MEVLGIRFCSVTGEAEALAGFLGDGLGMPRRDMPTDNDTFSGAVFPAGESWVEVWPEGPQMPAGTMLQIVVNDADAWAEQARENGLDPQGPMDAYGERIYFLEAPSGLSVSFQSRLASQSG